MSFQPTSLQERVVNPFFHIIGALIPWIIWKTSNLESITEIPLPAPAGCTHEEAFNKIEDLNRLPFDVEEWIHMEDGEEKLKSLQRAQCIFACRSMTEDKGECSILVLYHL